MTVCLFFALLVADKNFSPIVVTNYRDIQEQMRVGNANRKIAETAMNTTSRLV